MHGVSHMSRQS